MGGFSVQARVLDLLGKEQIANCPTAISELFKNAWDAYAENTAIDVYTDDDHAVVWDNGQGMSEEDVNKRWLLVGTSDKGEAPASKSPPEGYARRPVQGEKGIGRLAISTLGDNLLLISRSSHSDESKDPYVALFLNWNVVRNDKLLLGDIEVPVLAFGSLDDLASDVVKDMVSDFRRPIETPPDPDVWKGKKYEELRGRILAQLDEFQLDIASINRTLFFSSRHGTLFYVHSLTKEIPRYVRPPRRYEDEQEEPNIELVQLLCNFKNLFEPLGRPEEPAGSGEVGEVWKPEVPFAVDVRRWDAEKKVLRSAFADWETIGKDDLRFYDHLIDVSFDEFGRYEGVLEIYGETIPLPSLESQPKRRMGCGPLHLRFWYIQGTKGETTLPDEQWTRMAGPSTSTGKLDRFGGLMIYRDGLRVLPYGRPEYDWLRIEERRSRKADRYHFSYRRMFGYVAITTVNNPKLRDKAGREGLIADAMYGRFRQRLMDFLSEIALLYFFNGEKFKESKEGLKNRKGLVDEEKKNADEKREIFLKEARQRLKNSEQALEVVDEILHDSVRELGSIESPGEIDVAGALLRFQDRIAALEGKAKLIVPRRLSIGHNLELRRILHDHGKSFVNLQKTCDEARRAFSHEVQARYPESALTHD